MSTDVERLALEQAPEVARRLRATAGTGGTEADFRREAARILDDASVAVGLTITSRDEYHVARGNVDSLYNRLVLEYKRPGVLRPTNTSPANRRAIDQVKRYIEDVGVRDRREAHRLAGAVTDGLHLIFVRRVGEGWSEDEAMPVNTPSVELLLRLLFSLAVGAALIPENLVEDFGPRHLRAKTAVRAIYRGLSSTKSPLVPRLFEQWRTFFSEATDYREWAERIESKPEFREFVGSLWTKEEIRHLDPAQVFFVLHTYYALLIKLVASMAVARFANGATSPLTDLAGRDGDDLREGLVELERGGLFRHYGIRNFLEGDFFGWYLAAWNPDIEEAVSSMIGRLSEYDPGALELDPENARDLLKRLYHSLLPKEIRHDLGEYYTPDWLAERLIRQTLGEADLGDATKRVVDPACGSGTFLLILIKFIKERAARNRQPPERTLDLILRNVVGFDLNPLAVTAARTNYLIALGDLLKERGVHEIDIPVYQADSILAPSQGTDLFEGETYPLTTSVGTFRIPAVFAERERIDRLANILDETIEDGTSEDVFVGRVAKSARLEPEERKAADPGLRELHRQLRVLHDEGLNGVWARIIKNAFAPVFLEPCHFVVGNPPWVNWESLPDDYRESTIPLWTHYGLFPKRERAFQTILGAAKYDISMLMTYVAADKYLRPRGRLGFILSQSLFKTSGAGQGFRGFSLPDGTPIGPLVVEDMVELKPFEGASNRTAVAIFVKGHKVRYPVSYQAWRKRGSGRGSAVGFDTPYDDVTREKITFLPWQAEPIDPHDPTSAWITARPKCLRVLRKIVGGSPYAGRKGLTCSVNGVFWVEVTGTRPGGDLMVANVVDRARRPLPAVQATIENDLVYPLLRGADVARWVSSPELSVILTHQEGMRLKAIPEQDMQDIYPKTWHYLKRFEPRLRESAILRRYFSSSDPFYSLFNIGDYTFAPFKVLVREIASSLTSAVSTPLNGRPCIPDHKLVMVGLTDEEEAHFLCALLNSSPIRLLIESYTIKTQFSTHLFDVASIPAFTRADGRHIRLSELSAEAHDAAPSRDVLRLRAIEEEIDLIAADMWGLTTSEVADVGRFLMEI